MTTAVAPAVPTARLTTRLLRAGALAGPLYVALAGVQAATRDGFDPRVHAVSLLSIGDLGWVQIANFVGAGLLTTAGAVGLRRAVRHGSGAVWGPRLLGVYGASLVVAGVVVADPAHGFPAGTSDGPAAALTWHGLVHLAAGGIGFLAATGACLVLARRFARTGDRGWARASAATGVVVLGTFGALASGAQHAAVNLAFTAAVVLLWGWISAVLRGTARGLVSAGTT